MSVPRRLAHILALAVLGAPCLSAAAGPDLPAVERYVVEATNRFRLDAGLGALAVDARLAKAARYFAEYMASTDRYGHTADGAEAADRATRHGYEWCLVAENISYQYTSARFGTTDLANRYVEGWKGSPRHRKNMLDANALDTAVAVAQSQKTRRFYAVQLFGRARSQSVEFRVTNRAAEAVSYQVAGKTFPLEPRATRIHQQCGPAEVTLRGARAIAGKAAARAGHGDQLTVVRESGGYVLRGH
jgi:uncharacterized protein YkwD